MKAAVLTRHGGAEVVDYRGDLPVPEVGAGEVRVRIKAAALNRLDLWVRAGWRGLALDFPHVICADGAGIVDALGAGVTGFAPGDRVCIDPTIVPPDDPALRTGLENQTRIAILGEHHSGTAAEYVVLPQRNLLKMPAGFDFGEAAAVGLVGVTAWHSLITRGGLQPGETVLIVGAGGGVNSISIQIAKLAGAQVFVVGSNAEKCAQAEKIGADITINREHDPQWSRAVAKLTGRRGVDVVVDNVGAATLGQSMRACRIGGRILIVGGTSGYGFDLNVAQLFTRHISLIGSTMGPHQDYERFMQQAFAGRIQAVIGARLPLHEARQAQTLLENNAVFGKIVLEI
ncbi:MAG: zinc-binding dehydrogenase [Chloroflexi bacterium]|nr:zinc-binding dehydrogenase [Chloroflexota bacterium]MCY3581237.1 zinc-binding dehydrogenase [Chloroflexota bacterium]MCY3716644.1 zinc-binding dehydrogenase [Chloroflexota bacterium]MDE2651695.1 zinc-binding dehydrogenase [Chloroflexota bacterium]MXV93311.1 zinc-binding dehydrogenase [Chloroflexota bacterium]